MDNFERLHLRVRVLILSMMLIDVLLVAGVWMFCAKVLHLNDYSAIGISVGAGVLLSYLAVEILTDISLDPLRVVWQAIIHVDPEQHGVGAPNVDKLRIGRELVTSMTLRVYQYASQQDNKELMEHRKSISQAANIVSHLPLPLLVFNKELMVTNVSDVSIKYCGLDSSQLFGKPIFDALNLEFPSETTLETWIKDCQDNKITDTRYWERVRVLSKDQTYRQCDLWASYNRDNQSGTEFIVTLFDRTEQYNQDDESLSFVALAVHELRTPLTMLRGYIEVFQDELGSQLNTELHDFMLKMEASADQLTNFVHNILNVARIQNNQLVVHLNEADWAETIHQGAIAMEHMARVKGKVIEYDIEPNLPTVAVDQVTICEVINNLLDNAIKYSPKAENKRIVVTSKLNKEGLVETTVQDFGVGIPGSVLPNLFEKFYRNHRTSAQIGGTGLGLYLSKAVIDAHDGQIWANSKVDEGSTFGFTLLPFSKLAEEKKAASGNIVRQANGWIKNHSYYRR